MKKTVAWILALALLAVATVIGTVAYLTDVDSETNVFTIGNVDIDLLEYERINTETKDADANIQEFHDNKPLRPAVIAKGFDYTAGDTYVDWTQSAVDWKQDGENGYTSPIWDPTKINNEVDKMVFVKNTGDYSAYVRIFFAFEAGAYTTFAQFQNKIHLNLNDTDWTWEWEEYIGEKSGDNFFVACATYNYALAPGDYTEISLSQISLDPAASNVDARAFNRGYRVLVAAQGIQSEGFDTPGQALEKGFGTDDPFGLNYYKGVDLNTALHYFEGDKTGTQITKKVSSVTFGLKEDYPELETQDGTLTKNETLEGDQAVSASPVHTYYVPDGENYKLYVLADEGAVYAPKTCAGLFNEMTALTEVKAGSLNVKYATEMYNMFKGCSNLVTLEGTENWDVSKVTNMSFMFSGCQKLAALDVSTWQTNSLIYANYLFNSCASLETLDASRWNVNNVTEMNAMLSGCEKLKALELGGWDVGNVKTMGSMFSNCYELASLDVSDWNVESVNNFTEMFKNCSVLTSLDVSKWNTSNATLMGSMFYCCENLAILDVSKWDVGNVTVMNHMFYKCTSLAKLESSRWDTSKVTTMSNMFYSCSLLTELGTSGWNTANVTTMENMFFGCNALEDINVSNWDTSEVTTMQNMFFGCNALEDINVSNWDTSKVTTMACMFQNCYKLTNIAVSNWNTANVTTMQNMFYK